MMRDPDLETAEALLDKGNVMSLATAIQQTRDTAAAAALDVAFREFPSAIEWIAQARARRA